MSEADDFRSEEAEFWDTHSFADYWDETKMVKLVYKPEPKKAVIHVKVEYQEYAGQASIEVD